MYGQTPQSFENRIRYTLAKADSAPIRRLPLRTALVAACITILTVSAGLAAFFSQVADFFGKLYGDDKRDELISGKIAHTGDSVTIANVTYTLDEVVYIESGLYGVGRIIPADENTRLLTYDYTAEDLPALTGDEQLLYAQVIAEAVSVDGGDMIDLPTSSYSCELLENGSVQYAFTLPTGTAVTNGASYTLRMRVSTCQATKDGQRLEETHTIETWFVTFEPKAAVTVAPTPQPTAVPTIGNVKVITPESYQQTGTLPVYKAQQRTEENSAFFSLDPAVFNASGVAEHTTRDAYYREENYVFCDESRLRVTGITLEYMEYDGEYTIFYRLDGQVPDGPHPRPAFSSAVADLGHYAYWEQTGEQLENTALNGCTLSEAEKLAQDLFAQLDLDDYQLSYALDMTQERIARLGAQYTQAWAGSSYYYDKTWDYAAATKNDEGFFLLYTRQVDGISVDKGNFYNPIRLYVSGGVIRYVNIDDLYKATGDSYTPEKLVTAEEIIAFFGSDNVRRERHRLNNPTLQSLTLLYMPTRAQNAADGMIYAPVWYAEYTFTDTVPREGWAWYSALDGTLIEDCYSY